MYGQYLEVIENPQIVFYHDGMEFVEVSALLQLALNF